MSYVLFLLHKLRVTVYHQELRVTFYMRVTSYCSLHKLQVTFCMQVTSYCLLHDLRVNFYIRVTSYCLLHEWRVSFIARVTSYFFLFIARITSYLLTMNYDKDKDDKDAMIIILSQTTTPLDHLLIKNSGFAKPRFHVINI